MGVLGAIVFVGIMGLMSPGKIEHIYELNRRDFYIVMITILCTLFLGIDFGVALGVFASIVLFIQRAAKPNYSILGRVVSDPTLDKEATAVYRDVKMYPSNTEKRGDMLMIRWDAPIFFANASSFKKRVKKHIGRFLEENDYPKPWCLVLDFSGVNDVDYSGLEMLEAFFEELREKERGMTLLLAKLKTPVLNNLTRATSSATTVCPRSTCCGSCTRPRRGGIARSTRSARLISRRSTARSSTCTSSRRPTMRVMRATIWRRPRCRMTRTTRW